MNRRIILAALAAALSAAGAPVFFPRAQFHYGLERTDYLHRWHDRPLYQDSTFADANDPAHPINEKSWRATVRAWRRSPPNISSPPAPTPPSSRSGKLGPNASATRAPNGT